MNALSSSLEKYLEAVYHLERKDHVARITDLANRLGVQKPSVVSALIRLREKGYIDYRKNYYVILTDAGRNAAEEIVFKHSILEEFLKRVLSVDPDTASREALGMTHVISTDTAKQIRNRFSRELAL
jgi:DtxR family Mn-dependent transcriptional regulator